MQTEFVTTRSCGLVRTEQIENFEEHIDTTRPKSPFSGFKLRDASDFYRRSINVLGASSLSCGRNLSQLVGVASYGANRKTLKSM